MNIVDDLLHCPTLIGRDISDVLLWVGAGVSIDAPSSLPSGMELTEFVLDHTCGSIFKKKVLEKWESISYNINRLQSFSYQYTPRLETILEQVSFIEENDASSSYRFLEGFSSFKDAPYNHNHILLARFILRGGSVVTTNFDLCIEEAIEDITNSTSFYGIAQNDSSDSTGCSLMPGRIIHIHGCCADVSTLGATIRQVKKGLDSESKNFLMSFLRRPSMIVFWGYSLSDAFDVNMFLARNLFPKTDIVYCQYSQSEVPSFLTKLRSSVRSISVFHGSFVDLANTAFSIDDQSIDEPISMNFDWKREFKQRITQSVLDDYSAILRLKITYTLGINFLSKREISKTNKPNPYSNEDYHNTLALIHRMQNSEKKEFIHAKQAHEVYDFLGFLYAHGKLSEAQNSAMSIDEIREMLSLVGDGALTWNPYTSLSAICRPLILSFCRNPLKSKLSKIENTTVEKLKEISEELSNRSLAAVREVNQICTALRLYIMLSALTGVNSSEQEKELYMLYSEVSSVTGAICTLRDMSIKKLIMAKLGNSQDHFSESLKLIRCSLRIAKVAGDRINIKNGRLIKLMIIGNRIFYQVMKGFQRIG